LKDQRRYEGSQGINPGDAAAKWLRENDPELRKAKAEAKANRRRKRGRR
jgi:hypothetical protein